jgi:beta-xylosidase
MREKLSAAMQRFTVKDQDNTWYTGFRYSPAFGLGYEKGVTRRDPSCILKVGSTYYVWYTRTQPGPSPVGHAKATDQLRATPWDLADVWYATSEDGHQWTEQGPAVERGAKGSFDDRSVFTPDVLAHDGRYYLVYQVVTAPYHRCTKEQIALAWADSPDGPWTKSERPILEPDDSGEVEETADPLEATAKGAWDSLRVHDPALLYRQGQYWLFFKGEGIGWSNKESKWGVAKAEDPLGPYFKSPLNPVTNSGHEVMVWPYDGGVAGLLIRCGPEKNTIQYAPDGLNFEIKATVIDPPRAPGAYRVAPDENTEPLAGLSWGLSHITELFGHRVQMGRDELELAKIKEPSDFIIRWERDESELSW